MVPLLAAALLVGVAGLAKADNGNGPPPRVQNILGMVLNHRDAHGAGGAQGLGNLRYHNGPVELTNKVYAIYWVPSGYTVSSSYESLISRFFTDVAAANGSTSNVYYSDTQYYNSSNQHIAYSSTYGGSVVDTNPLPASGCTDSVTPVCLSDAQIQSEVARVAAAQGWSHNPNNEFFMFTAKNIGSCVSSSECSFSYYCAYHSWFGSGSTVTLYANMPYADTDPSACDAESHPNGDDADATINVTSHEHNETITDEQGNAWYDLEGYENGDKCAWNFGSQIGSTSHGNYNQLINGDPYELQLEYSNAHRTCVQTGT
jgi:hypothetical protein